MKNAFLFLVACMLLGTALAPPTAAWLPLTHEEITDKVTDKVTRYNFDVTAS